jgi:hypothetical protein
LAVLTQPSKSKRTTIIIIKTDNNNSINIIK